MLSVLTQFLSSRSQHVVVDGCRSKLVNLVSGVPKGRVLDPQFFLLYTTELFSIVENMLYGCADDSTLVAVVPSPAERVAVTESLNRDLNRVSVTYVTFDAKMTFQKHRRSVSVLQLRGMVS